MQQRPKIVLPIVEAKQDSILKTVDLALLEPCDMLEWRVDYYQESSDIKKVKILLSIIYKKVQQASKQLIVTFRTQQEGGHVITKQGYRQLLESLVKEKRLDFLDVEYAQVALFDLNFKKQVKNLDIGLILSYHHFGKMPEISVLTDLVEKMRCEQAAVYKVAVTPEQPQEVLDLLSLQLSLHTRYQTESFVVIGMGELGSLTRVSGNLTGSYLTFASFQKKSASGQLSSEEMTYLLEKLKID